MKYYLATVIFSLALLSQFANAQQRMSKSTKHSSNIRTLGYSISFDSKALESEMNIDIYLPDSYDKSTKSYPVVYLFDSEYLFDLTVASLKSRWQRELAPESIIVGIDTTSVDARINFAMPIKRPNGSVFAGHAKPVKMAQFVSAELNTFIEQHYRTAPYRIGIGLSPTATNIIYDFLLEKPFFDAHIALASDLHFTSLDDEPLYQLIEAKMKSHASAFFYHSKAMSDFSADNSGKNTYLALHKKNQDYQGRFITAIPANTEHYALAALSINDAFGYLFPRDVWLPDYSVFRDSATPVKDVVNFYNERSHNVGYQTYPLIDSYWSINNIRALSEQLIRQEKRVQARQLIEWTLSVIPGNGQLHLLLSKVHLSENNIDLAELHANIAIELAMQHGDSAELFIAHLNAVKAANKQTRKH